MSRTRNIALAVIAVMAGALAAVAAAFILGKTVTVNAATTSTAADTAQPCSQLLQPDPHTAFICVAANAFNKYGADYWMDTAYGRMQFIHPADGLLDVSDAYYCRPSSLVAGGHVQSVDAGATSSESWCARGAPGVPVGEAEWQARVISVYDGHGACVVYGWKVTDSQVNPPAPKTCFDEYTGKLRPMTALEVKSVVYGWHAMADEPGAW